MKEALRFAGGVVAGAATRPRVRRRPPRRPRPVRGITPEGSLPDSASLSEVEATLHEYAGLTREKLGRYVPAKEPSRYLYDLVASSAGAGGKGLRPAICIAACKAFGGKAEQAVHAAVSFELLHAAFLIHDDVEDGSKLRRGRPTLHERYNPALAVNAGDSLAALSLSPLIEGLASTRRRRRTLEVVGEFQRVARETIEGQAIELGWITHDVLDATFTDYLSMTLKKTSWYTVIGPCRVGALLGSKWAPHPARFLRFGFYLGAMFQIQDDLRNLLGGSAGYDEVPKSDIREGKRTLMLIHLLLKPKPRRETEELHRILRFDHVADDDEVEWVFEMMERYGSLTVAKACVRSMATNAVREFEAAFGDLAPSADKRFLAGLTPYLYAIG